MEQAFSTDAGEEIYEHRAIKEKVENGEGGIRTPGRGVYPYDGLANRCLKPLGHLSEHYSIIYSMQAGVARR